MTTYSAITHGKPACADNTPDRALKKLHRQISGDNRMPKTVRAQVWESEQGAKPKLIQDVEMDLKTGEWRRV